MENKRPQRSDETLNNVLEVFQALSHPVRLEICRILMVQPYSVGTLCTILDMKQYAISQQLAVLRKAQIVTPRREARHVIYALTNTKVQRILTVSIANVASTNSHPISDLDQEKKACEDAKSL